MKKEVSNSDIKKVKLTTRTVVDKGVLRPAFNIETQLPHVKYTIPHNNQNEY